MGLVGMTFQIAILSICTGMSVLVGGLLLADVLVEGGASNVFMLGYYTAIIALSVYLLGRSFYLIYRLARGSVKEQDNA